MFKNNNNIFTFSLYGNENENEVDANDVHMKEKHNSYNTTSHIISAKEFNREFLLNRNSAVDNENPTYINGNGKIINDYNGSSSNASNNNNNKIIMDSYDKNMNLAFHMKNKSNEKITYENMNNTENSDKAFITNNVKKFLGNFDFLNFKSKNILVKNGKNNNSDNNNHYIGSENVTPNKYNNNNMYKNNIHPSTYDHIKNDPLVGIVGNNKNNDYRNNDTPMHYSVNNSGNNKYKAENILNYSEYEIINSISNNSSHTSNIGISNEASYNNFFRRSSNKNVSSEKSVGIINNNMKFHNNNNNKNNADIKELLNNMKREKNVYDKEKKNIDGEYLAHACNYEKIKNNLYAPPKMDKNSEQVINNNQNFYGMEKNVSSCISAYDDKNKSEYPTYAPYYNYDKKKRGVENDKGKGYNFPGFYDLNQDKIENRINQKNSFIIEEFEKKNQSIQNSTNGSVNFIYANTLK
ncbi:homeobox-containing protein, partial [Plasmodium yoelii yoelii]